MVVHGAKPTDVAGIVSIDTPLGPRAQIAKTGTDVYQVVKALREFGGDRGALEYELDWLKPAQIKAALAYYERHTDEIDALLALADSLTPASARPQ